MFIQAYTLEKKNQTRKQEPRKDLNSKPEHTVAENIIQQNYRLFIHTLLQQVAWNENKKPIQLFGNWLVYSFSNGQNSYEVQSCSKGITQEFCRVAHGVPMRKVFTSPRKGREGKHSYKCKFFPHLLLSSVKEILHTNIKLEQNIVQSYFQLFRRTGEGGNKKPNIFSFNIQVNKDKS